MPRKRFDRQPSVYISGWGVITARVADMSAVVFGGNFKVKRYARKGIRLYQTGRVHPGLPLDADHWSSAFVTISFDELFSVTDHLLQIFFDLGIRGNIYLTRSNLFPVMYAVVCGQDESDRVAMEMYIDQCAFGPETEQIPVVPYGS